MKKNQTSKDKYSEGFMAALHEVRMAKQESRNIEYQAPENEDEEFCCGWEAGMADEDAHE